jgi:branched-chain amino acid aminotransferase
MPQPDFIWKNGEILAAESNHLSALDHGFTVGSGAFETLIALEAQPFALDRHWQRLSEGCHQLHISPPDKSTVQTALKAVLQANQLSSARLRFTVTSGPGPAGASPADQQHPTYLAMATPLQPSKPTDSLVSLPWSRNERGALVGIKSTSYAESVRALHHARSRGAGEALFLNTQHEICECAASNIFIVIDGQLYTPPLSSGCLAGITRQLIIEAAASSRHPVIEEPLHFEQLHDAEEIFITSTLRGVQPITQVDQIVMPAAPGPVTLLMRSLYYSLQEQHIDP